MHLRAEGFERSEVVERAQTLRKGPADQKAAMALAVLRFWSDGL